MKQVSSFIQILSFQPSCLMIIMIYKNQVLTFFLAFHRTTVCIDQLSYYNCSKIYSCNCKLQQAANSKHSSHQCQLQQHARCSLCSPVKQRQHGTPTSSCGQQGTHLISYSHSKQSCICGKLPKTEHVPFRRWSCAQLLQLCFLNNQQGGPR